MNELLYEYLLMFFVSMIIGLPVGCFIIDRKMIERKAKRILRKIVDVFDRGNSEEAALRFVNDVNRRKYMVKYK